MADELERRAERVRLGLEEAAPTPIAAEVFFGRYLDEVVALLKDPETIRWSFNKHITPHFKGKALGSIGVAEAQAWVSKLSRATPPLAPVTQKNLRVRFSVAMNVAKSWKLIKSNPFDQVKGLKVPHREPVFLDLEEIARLIQHVPPVWRVCVMVAISTGLRRGELFGMRKGWIDFATQTIRVLGSYDSPSTKSNKPRTVPIPDEVVPVLRTHVEQLQGELVFPRPNGSMYGPQFEPSELLKKWAEAAGIAKELRWHDLRATYATHANAQADSRFTQAVLGHASLVTSERYIGIAHSRLMKEGRALRLVSGADPAPTDSPPKGGKKN
jgi:integrase